MLRNFSVKRLVETACFSSHTAGPVPSGLLSSTLFPLTRLLYLQSGAYSHWQHPSRRLGQWPWYDFYVTATKIFLPVSTGEKKDSALPTSPWTRQWEHERFSRLPSDPEQASAWLQTFEIAEAQTEGAQTAIAVPHLPTLTAWEHFQNYHYSCLNWFFPPLRRENIHFFLQLFLSAKLFLGADFPSSHLQPYFLAHLCLILSSSYPKTFPPFESLFCSSSFFVFCCCPTFVLLPQCPLRHAEIAAGVSQHCTSSNQTSHIIFKQNRNLILIR